MKKIAKKATPAAPQEAQADRLKEFAEMQAKAIQRITLDREEVVTGKLEEAISILRQNASHDGPIRVDIERDEQGRMSHLVITRDGGVVH